MRIGFSPKDLRSRTDSQSQCCAIGIPADVILRAQDERHASGSVSETLASSSRELSLV